MGTRTLVPAVLVLLSLAACAEDEAGVDPMPASVDSAGGLYTLGLTPSADPYGAGEEVSLQVALAGDAGPVTGAVLTLDPWMPDMGHGISDAPVITELDDGVYEARWTFSMPGWWDLQFSIDAADGPDTAVVGIDVQ